jgi:hypothetical protein
VGPETSSLRQYDATRYGPFLGVSDEGSAVSAIRDAARASPKTRALGAAAAPLTVGVSHDAERLGSIGEVPVGPDEYARIMEVARGEILVSTNVGSHVNHWRYRDPPVCGLDADPGEINGRLERFRALLSGRPRSVLAYVELPADGDHAAVRPVLESLVADTRGPGGEVRLGLLVSVNADEQGAQSARQAIELAAGAGVGRVAIRSAGWAQEGRVLQPGLLAFFNVALAESLMGHAAQRGVAIGPLDVVDADSVARQVWTGLHAARATGLNLGKYGLVPLTLAESDAVVKKVQPWFGDWTAAPALYVDSPIVAHDRIYDERDLPAAIERWGAMVVKHGVEVVLIDTVYKAQGRHLLKQGAQDDRGFLTYDELVEVNDAVRASGVKALWAGGIRREQVFDIGRLRPFGIYVTTAAANEADISPSYEDDVTLEAEREPTREGVGRVKLLLEAGFLAAEHPDRVAELKSAAAEEERTAELEQMVEHLWRQRFSEEAAG